MKNFREHFTIFLNKIKQKENFAFARYSDGEMNILQNTKAKLDKNLIQIGDKIMNGPYHEYDFKDFDPKEHQIARERLIEAFKHKQPNYYKGISCSCCVGKENFDWQIELHGGDDESLTWSNLWVNGNYHLFMQKVFPLFYNRECVMICHEKADLSKLPFIIKDFRVGYNAFVNDYHKIQDIKKWIHANKIENKLFLFSASSFSNLAIYELYKEYPNNSYVDIGTCITPQINMPIHRDYLQRYWYYIGGGDMEKICIWN